MLLITVDLDGNLFAKCPGNGMGWDGMPHMDVLTTERGKSLLNFINRA